MKPLSMIEVKEIVGDSEENQEISSFIKKFVKMDKKKVEELGKELRSLGILKVKEEHIVKMIDILPEDASDLNKIFVESSLDQDETNKIIDTIKKYK